MMWKSVFQHGPGSIGNLKLDPITSGEVGSLATRRSVWAASAWKNDIDDPAWAVVFLAKSAVQRLLVILIFAIPILVAVEDRTVGVQRSRCCLPADEVSAAGHARPCFGEFRGR